MAPSATLRMWEISPKSPYGQHMCGYECMEPLEHTKQGIFEGWADGRGVYWPRKRWSWIAKALENFAARPSPSLCEIRKAVSISSFEHESEKKARRARGLGSDSGLDLAISRFTNSLVCDAGIM